MPNLYSASGVSEMLKRYGIAPLKALGQNFLIDRNVVEKIAEAAVLPGENVMEIGPGPGGLTTALSERAKRVLSVEIDKGMIPILRTTLSNRQNVEILHSDFLKTDINKLSETYFQGEKFAVAGNLPYYITAKCILKALEIPEKVTRITAMVQQEVAERLAASPGGKAYGALTASVAYFGDMKLLFPVTRGCFFPAPDVDSAVVQIVPVASVDALRETYVRVVRALFSMRRKTVLNNVKAGFSLNAEAAAEALERAGIPLTARAEQLNKEDFAALARVLS